MEKIPTAEEFYKQTTGCVINHRDIKAAMIEFAKLHVEQALEEASRCTDIYDFESEIKSSYPLENIK